MVHGLFAIPAYKAPDVGALTTGVHGNGHRSFAVKGLRQKFERIEVQAEGFFLSFLCISESMVLDKTTERDEKAEGEHEEQANIDTTTDRSSGHGSEGGVSLVPNRRKTSRFTFRRKNITINK